MLRPILFSIPAVFLLGLVLQRLNIKWATHLKLLDIPTARRRHARSTPITGGVGVILAWALGVATYAAFHPDWYTSHTVAISVIGTSVAALVILGILDDLHGLSPVWKLLVEFVVAGAVVRFEPQVNSLCLAWSSSLGDFVWPLAMVWIVGITNAINLIDGLDGLAGGMSVLVAGSILVLSAWTGEGAEFATVTTAMLIPAVLAFLRYNWAPAKIFLGDNGSLPLGFLLATNGLMCRPQTKSWIMIISILLMLGYPMLDMAMSVYRRYTKKQPLFKADRNHLHYRIRRLGLNVPQTASMILSIGLFLQVSSLCINLMAPPSAAFGISLVIFSIYSLLHLVRSIEKWRIQRIYDSGPERKHTPVAKHQTIINIEIETLLEAAMLEEQARYSQLLVALELLLSTLVRKEDMLFSTEQKFSIVLSNDNGDAKEWELIRQRFQERIDEFLKLYNLQCSLASIPISFERVSMLNMVPVSTAQATTATTEDVKKAS